MRGVRHIAGLLILILMFPSNVVSAAKNGKITVVVVPVHNANYDEETNRAVDSVRSLLKANSKLYVVDKEKADSVLHYYDRKGEGAEKTDVQRLLAGAKDSYYRFNYVEAKSLVRKAISTLEGLPQSVCDHGRNLIEAYLTLGIISRSMGNVGEARQAFRKALRLDPDYRLDSRAFPPSLVNVFEDVRGSLEAQPRGKVRVESNPKVAEVYINGVMKGVTPLTIDNLPEGVHHLRISANKYEVIRKQINVGGGQVIKVKERLTWLGGKQGKFTGKNFVSAVGDLGQVDEALKVADLLRTDKVILVDVDGGQGASGVITARMIDAKYRAGHKPVVLSYGQGGDGVSKIVESLSKELSSQAYVDIANNPEKYVDPPGAGDPVLMGKKKRGGISKPVLFGVLGGVLAVGLGAGLAAAFAGGGGGGGGSETGSVGLTFK